MNQTVLMPLHLLAPLVLLAAAFLAPLGLLGRLAPPVPLAPADLVL
jgi:hypothetical protein